MAPCAHTKSFQAAKTAAKESTPAPKPKPAKKQDTTVDSDAAPLKGKEVVGPEH